MGCELLEVIKKKEVMKAKKNTRQFNAPAPLFKSILLAIMVLFLVNGCHEGSEDTINEYLVDYKQEGLLSLTVIEPLLATTT